MSPYGLASPLKYSPAVHASHPFPFTGRRGRRPRVLLVTPELSQSRFLSSHGKQAPCMKAGGLADVNALLVDSLHEAGADVHVAVPHFRCLYQPGPTGHSRKLHLCQDREFFYRRSVYEGCPHSNLRASLAFQRDVIQYVLPKLRPDIVHCHDWMTGLVPGAARSMGIPSIFTVHNLHDERTVLSHIEDRGIDAARFWQHLYYQDFPGSYEAVRHHNPVSLLASGILASDQMNTVSHSFLHELERGYHGAPWQIVDSVRGKIGAGCAHGISNSLPHGFSPRHDPHLTECYDQGNPMAGKRANKRTLQYLLGLEADEEAPILFWPSRLDPVQKGCQLMADTLYRIVSDYWGLGLQVVFIADGPFHSHFENIARQHGLQHRIAVRGFNENLSRLGYAASDFTLMPSSYEPCGLSQMIGLVYGSLPIAHATGGLRDTVTELDAAHASGNGFLFNHFNAEGLRSAIDRAVRFYIQPPNRREETISRIMREASHAFRPAPMIDQYLALYQNALRPR